MSKDLTEFLSSPPSVLAFLTVMTAVFLYLHLGISVLRWVQVSKLIHDRCIIGVDITRVKLQPKDTILVSPSYTKHNWAAHSHDVNNAVWSTIESCFVWRPAFWISDKDDNIFIGTIFVAILLFLTRPDYAAVLPPVFLVCVAYAKVRASSVGKTLKDLADTCRQDHENFQRSNSKSFDLLT